MEQAEGPVRTKCFCPNTPHEHDEFHLVEADRLPPEAGFAAAMAVADAGGNAAAAELIGALLRHGAIARWNLVDDKGDAVPVNPRTVGERVSWTKGGLELTSAALSRYVTDEHAPFGSGSPPSRKMNGTSSPSGPMEPATSATTGRSSTRRKRSEPSSPASSDGQPSVESP